MAESTVNPATYSTEILDSSGNSKNVYIYLDRVNDNGVMRILTFRNIIEKYRQNEDGTITKFYNYIQNVINNWTLPGSYTKDGVELEIGTDKIIIENGKETTIREINIEEARAYVIANASEIAGFLIQTKIKVVG